MTSTRRTFLAGASATALVPRIATASGGLPTGSSCRLILERTETWSWDHIGGESITMQVHATHVQVGWPLHSIVIPERGNNDRRLFPAFEINDYGVVVKGYPGGLLDDGRGLPKRSTKQILMETCQAQVRALMDAQMDIKDFQGFYVYVVTPDKHQHHMGLVRRDGDYDSDDIIWNFQPTTPQIFKA